MSYIFIFTPVLLVVFTVVVPDSALGSILPILHYGNGLGSIILLVALIWAGVLLNRGKKLASVKRLVISSGIYLLLLAVLDFFQLDGGYLGKTVYQGLYAMVGQSADLFLVIVLYALFAGFTELKSLHVKEQSQEFATFRQAISDKAKIIRETKEKEAMRDYELEVLAERREKRKLLREPAKTPTDIPTLAIRHKRRVTAPKQVESKPYRQVPLSVLPNPPRVDVLDAQEGLNDRGLVLEKAFADYDVKLRFVEAVQSPTVTRFEFETEAGTRLSKIGKLEPEMAMVLSASNVRIEAPIPNTNRIGVEVPNPERYPVYFKQIQSLIPDNAHPLQSALGVTIDGTPMFLNIAEMPHLLVAGATGSGKSVGINAMISSIIMRSSPEQVQFSMVDPKMVEFTAYNGIPHLKEPVITEVEPAVAMVSRAVDEMEERYNLLQEYGVRNLESYNQSVNNPLPYYVIVIDEFAELMEWVKATSKRGEGNPLETAVCRLAAKARAVGIHLVLATQRPSVDVVTGLIKANFPSRIAFATKTGTDSRTILDQNGAETLLGKGDMLYYPREFNKPMRVQGLFLKDEEIQSITHYMKGAVRNSSFQSEPSLDDL